MDWTALTEKVRSEHLQDSVGLHENAPTTMRVCRVIGGMGVIVCKGDRVRHLIRDRANNHLEAKRAQDGHKFVVEIRHRARRERHGLGGPLTRSDEEAMLNEVEINAEDPAAIRDR